MKKITVFIKSTPVNHNFRNFRLISRFITTQNDGKMRHSSKYIISIGVMEDL